MAHAQSRGLELSVGLALPATLGLIVLSEPIVRLLFEHGAFTAADTAATAHALMWLALALPAHVLAKALSPAFFAREDTLTPLVATLKGFGAGDRRGLSARPLVRRRRHRRRHRARRMGHRAEPDPPRRGDVRVFDRRRRASGGCRASCWRRWSMGALLWLGSRLVPALAFAAHGLVQAMLLLM